MYNSTTPFTFNGVLYYLAAHTNGTIYRYTALTYPPQTTTKYYDPTFTHTFTTPGIYNLTLHCDQGFPQGPSAYCKQVVVVNSMTGVNLGNDTTVCASSYTIGSGSGSGTTYLWSNGATTPSITVTTSGTYWVATNGACINGSDTINITLQPAISVTLDPDTAICSGQSVTLQAQGNYVTPSFLWSNGSSGTSINVNQSGTYWVQVTQGPCITSDSVTVDVQAPPVVDLGNDKTYCEGGSTQLQSSNTYTNATYLWSTGNTGTSITVSQPGTYWLAVSTLPGCNGSDTVNISEVPSPLVMVSNDTSICPGDEVLIQSLGNHTNPAYLWSTGAGTPGTIVSQPGLYWLQVTQNGCTGTDSVNITALPVPQVNISNTDSICAGSTVVLSSPQPDNSQYLWSTGSTDTSITVATGEYWLLVTNEYSCFAADTIDIHYYESPYVTLPADTTICNGDVLNLYPVSYYGSIMWSNNSSAVAIPVTQEGAYYVTVSTVCTSAADSVYINVEDCEIWLPNAFTPNGDGKNDIFRLLGNIGMVTDLTFVIYNRFGECVFETNDATIGWNGIYRNNNQDVGTFGYYVKCTIGSRDIKMKGFLHLIK